MHVSTTRVLVAIAVSGAIRLATLYLRRLDAREGEGPEPERRAIAASRRRAQGHLWLLGALMSSLFVFALLFGVDRPPLDLTRIVLLVGLALLDAFCVHKAIAAYEDARRRGSAAAR